MKVARHICAWLVVVVLVTCGLPEFAAGDASVERHVRYGFTLRNTTGKPIPRAELWTFAPVERTAHQVCRKLAASHPHEILGDSRGNRVLHFVFEPFAPYATKIVTVEADLSLFGLGSEVAESEAAAWLGAGPLIEFDSPDFEKQAPRFSVRDDTAGQAHEIFRWVAGNLESRGYDRRDRGALHALTHGSGDCTEYMYLFVALCRRAAIPARGLGGFRSDRNRMVTASGYHNWAEFAADGRWHVADAQRGIFMSRGETYVAMRIMGPADPADPLRGFPRFRYEGQGLNVRMQ